MRLLEDANKTRSDNCTCVTDVKDVSESLNVDTKTFLVFVF